MAENVKELKLGEKVRGLRQRANLSVAELAKQSGVSEAILSQVEEGVVIPTVATLLNVAKSLNVGLGHFFQDTSAQRMLEVVRREERKLIPRGTRHDENEGEVPLSYSYETLSHRLTNKHMQPFHIEVDLDVDDNIPMLSHEGEEFLFVLGGEIEFRSDMETIRLCEGDSLYFDAKIPHALIGRGSRKPHAVAVVYSPRPDLDGASSE